jgi:hypothetical protein
MNAAVVHERAQAAPMGVGAGSWPWVAGPPGGGYLTAVNGDGGGGGVIVVPYGVVPGWELRVHGCVLGVAAGLARADPGMGPGAGRLAGRADLDFPAVQFRRRAQDQGADAGAQLEYHAARAGRAGDRLGHDALQGRCG